VRDNDTKEGQSDPVYGTAIAECWRLLIQGENDTGKGGKKQTKNAKEAATNSIDFGINELNKFLSSIELEDLRKCLAPRDEAPVLLPAYLDLLSQTAPAPAVEPDIRLFLHGKERGVPEVRLVWRADFSFDNSEAWKELAALCPPVIGEMLAMPLHRVRAWLAEVASADGDMSDVEGALVSDDGADKKEAHHNAQAIRPVLVWRGRDRSNIFDLASAIRPNDVILLPDAYGMPDGAQSAPYETVGAHELDLWESAQRNSGRLPALRLNRAVLASWLECASVKELVEIAENPVRERVDITTAIDALIADHTATVPLWLLNLLREVRDGRVEDHPGRGCVLFARSGAASGAAEPDIFADDDDLMSAIGGEVTLRRHSASVEHAIKRIAGRCLSKEFLDPLQRAAYWHDVGKLDERFQLMLRQGDEIANGLGEPLAKSAAIPRSPSRRRAIRDAAGLPEGFRHEMLSLQLTERHAHLPVAADARDLVLHLVASHHGHGRPFAPIVPDLEPPGISGRHDGVTISLSAAERAGFVVPHRLGSGVPDRFWRLTRRYGWWGLAYLEAILRLADWYGSEYVLDEDPAQEAAPLPSEDHRADVMAAAPTDKRIVLTGLDGANPLGFLAALGTLLTLGATEYRQARLAWTRAATWQPVLTGVASVERDGLCEAIAAALRGRPVSDGAEANRMKSQGSFDHARKGLKDKQREVKDRRLRGQERKEAIEKEVVPLEREMYRKRSAWLETLKRAIPSPELALGKHIDCTGDEYRQYATDFLQESNIAKRSTVDLLAAFASDGYIERLGRVSATPFCFITGSGHQYFLDTARQLMGEATPERVRSALFEPWTYTDKGLSLRWDPREAARYALMDVDPGPLGAYTVWMANLLAYKALVLFPSAPGASGLQTTGWSRSTGEFFTWPIWERPADPDTIRSMLLLDILAVTAPDRSALRASGIATIFRAQRVKVGSGTNFKINFTPARGV
jgi:CRISPR-associated endonuclease Cas3-HD